MTMDDIIEISEKMNRVLESGFDESSDTQTIESLGKRVAWLEKYSNELTNLSIELLKMLVDSNTTIKGIQNQMSKLIKTQEEMLENNGKLIALLQIGDDVNACN